MQNAPRPMSSLTFGPVRLVLIGLCLLASQSAWAEKGHVTIVNCGTEKVWVGSYDWGDTTLTTAYESSTFSVGDQHTLHCVKNLFTQDSPGCQVKIKDGTSTGLKLGQFKVDNGTYTLGTLKDDAECATSIKVCLKQQSQCATAPSISSNTSDCDFSAEAGITTSCPR